MKLIDNILFVQSNDSAKAVAEYCRGRRFKAIVITEDWSIQNRTKDFAMAVINRAGPVRVSNFQPRQIDPRKPKPCLHCGSNLVDPEGIIVNMQYRPACLNCGAAALSLDAWNDRSLLIERITYAIDQAIRKASCSSYDEWKALIEATIDNPQYS